ncbi:MAG: methylmalonyl-CoA mutase family protein [Phenylobacterium sp.]
MSATPLASGFAPASADDWRALVTKTLKDRPIESLTVRTVEGLTIEPLYPTTGAGEAIVPLRDAERPWDLRALSAHPDPAQANRELLTDLEGGAASVALRIDPTGAAGVAIGSAAELARALDKVVLELAPVSLDAGFLGPQAADWLHALAKSSPGARLNFHLDPLSAFAQAGASEGPIESHVVAAANAAVRLADAYPRAELFLASGRVVHEAGGGEAAEIAFAAAAALTYARARARAGQGIEAALSGITLGLAADTDVFLTIAKLRAARLVFGRIAEACGAKAPAPLEVRSSDRMLAAKDAWTNMIRLTAAGLGAAVGGADAIVLGAFTDPLGLPTAFARRQSRNTQLVLMEEAHVGKVADPAAGSGYVEALTDQLARAAWSELQAIEAHDGGLPAALAAGHVARGVQAALKARPTPKLVGVNLFPPDKESPVEVEKAQPRAAQAPRTRLPGPDGACPALKPIRLSDLVEAAQ